MAREINRRGIITGLAAPNAVNVLNLQMVRVALPAIRSGLELRADTVGWLVTIYALAQLVLMPLYGRLGDELGKRRVFLTGMVAFLSGTTISLAARGLPLLLIGRAIQGAGAGCVVPLSIAIISDKLPPGEQGAALGTWNATGPVSGVISTLLAGFLVDAAGWSIIFVPVLAFGLLALFTTWRFVPADLQKADFRVLLGFDWGGPALLGGGLIFLLLYVSSEVVTGRPSLRDWRLLAGCLVLFGAFVIREVRHKNPFVSLDIFGDRSFTWASLCAALRMMVMSGVMFLMPLYLADVRELGAASTSLVLVFFDAALGPGMHWGGRLVDRVGNRWPLVLGMGLQVATIAFFALLSEEAPIALVAVGLAAHGIGAGIAIPALHRGAMEGPSDERSGTAAGVYSTIRYCGRLIGTAVVGVVLQRGLDSGLMPADAYPLGFWFIAAVGVLGPAMGFGVRN
jgi:EmrB/QacA subfamily drug resistance transporter